MRDVIRTSMSDVPHTPDRQIEAVRCTLSEHSALLETNCHLDPNAVPQYEALSDSLIWTDERRLDYPRDLSDALRLVFNFRTHIILGTDNLDMNAWANWLRMAPAWIGFASSRTRPTEAACAEYRRGDLTLRWCLRKLERDGLNNDG